MRDLCDMQTVQEVDDHIQVLCQNYPLGYRRSVEEGTLTPWDPDNNPKLQAVLLALERRAELAGASVFRDGHHHESRA